MSDNGDRSGASSPAPTNGGAGDEELVELDMIDAHRMRLSAFYGREIPRPDAERLLEIMLREQHAIETQMIGTMLDPQSRLTHPNWGIDISVGNGKQHSALFGPKLMAEARLLPPDKQPEAFLKAACVLAMLTDGLTARALLKLLGCGYQFISARSENKIII